MIYGLILDNANPQYGVHYITNGTNMMVGEHEIQTFKEVVVILLFLLVSFDVLSP